MKAMEEVGKTLLVIGIIVAVLGFLFMLGPRLPFRIGRLPLDFHYERDNVRFYFPLGTSILLSLLLTLVFSLFHRR